MLTRGFFYFIIYEMSGLNLLIKPSSSLCNIACSYCFYLDTATHRCVSSYGMMSDETAQMLIQKAFSYATHFIHFGFQGGEPTLIGLDFYRKFHQWVTVYNSKKIPVTYSLQTNGTLLNDEWAYFFKQHHYLIGISLDGFKEIHDIFRLSQESKGTFDQVLKGIHILRTHNVDFNILTVVTKALAHRGTEVFQYFQEQNFRYLQFIPCLELLGNNEGFALSSDDYLRFLLDTFPLYKEALLTDNYTSVRYFDNLVGFFLGQDFESCDMRGRCSVNPVIEADGSVYPCDFYVFDQYKLGSVYHHEFSELLHSKVGTNFCSSSFLIHEKCHNCPYLRICRGGGCKRHRLDDHLTNRFCSAYFHFFQQHKQDLIEIAQIIKTSKNNNIP